MKKLLNRIEELFKENLSSKTNWGRDQILFEYKQAVGSALIEKLQEMDEKNFERKVIPNDDNISVCTHNISDKLNKNFFA